MLTIEDMYGDLDLLEVVRVAEVLSRVGGLRALDAELADGVVALAVRPDADSGTGLVVLY